ncbi:MAG: hypothetical protein ACIAQZ_01420 [Sedimentisphaeraceae bacterium JB056]
MKKIISKNKLIVILSIMVSIAFYLINRNPEYVWLEDNSQLKDLRNKVIEIDINRINDGYFNFKKRNTLVVSDILARFAPITDHDRILEFVDCIILADKYQTSDTDSVIFFKTGNRIFGYKMYYLRADWDNEKIYGSGWQSKELYETIEDWKGCMKKRVERGRERALRQMEEKKQENPDMMMGAGIRKNEPE